MHLVSTVLRRQVLFLQQAYPRVVPYLSGQFLVEFRRYRILRGGQVGRVLGGYLPGVEIADIPADVAVVYAIFEQQFRALQHRAQQK